MVYFINFLTHITHDIFYIRINRFIAMRYSLIILFTFFSLVSFSQEKANEASQEVLKLEKKANGLVYEGNSLIADDKFTLAEKAYRKALSKQSNHVAGLYNLGNSYYENGLYDEALLRQQQAIKNAQSKAEKHKAFHNIGNILMKNKKCKEAVEAYKNALRNDPTDDETRYNLAIAKDCAKKQEDNQDKNDQNKDKNKDQDKDEKDQNKDQENQDKKDQNKDQDKKDDGKDEKDDQGKPEDDKKDTEKGDQKDDPKKQPQKPQKGQLSPQQIKNLLEAMNNQEQKVQEKINAEKQKGVKVKTDKDW